MGFYGIDGVISLSPSLFFEPIMSNVIRLHYFRLLGLCCVNYLSLLSTCNLVNVIIKPNDAGLKRCIRP